MENNSINSPTDKDLIITTNTTNTSLSLEKEDESTTNKTEKLNTNFSNSSNNSNNQLINIVLKSIQNASTKIKVNPNTVIKNEIPNILQCIGGGIAENTHEIKIIFGGKILQQQTTFTSNGIKEGHTLLYMIKEKENLNQVNSEISRNVSLLVENTEQSIRNNQQGDQQNQPGGAGSGADLNSNIDLRTLVTTQGFSRFREYGVPPEEIHMMRVMFHTNYLINNRNAPRSAWSPQEVIRREEEWVQQQNQQNNVEGGGDPAISLSQARNAFNSRLYNLIHRGNNENGDAIYEIQVSEYFL